MLLADFIDVSLVSEDFYWIIYWYGVGKGEYLPFHMTVIVFVLVLLLWRWTQKWLNLDKKGRRRDRDFERHAKEIMACDFLPGAMFVWDLP